MQQNEYKKLLRSLLDRLETELREAKEQQARAEADADFPNVFYTDGKIIALLEATGMVLDCLSKAKHSG